MAGRDADRPPGCCRFREDPIIGTWKRHAGIAAVQVIWPSEKKD